MKAEPQKYITDGGASFDNEAEAKRWEKVEEATASLDDAAEAWERAVLETATTADGQPFKLDRFAPIYWQIFGGYDSAPRVCKVEFYPRDVRLDTDSYRGPGVKIEYVWRDPWPGTRGQSRPNERRTVRVDELYSTKKAANLAACEMNAERLAREYAVAADAAEECGAAPPPAIGPRTCQVCCWPLIASGRAIPGNVCPGCEGKKPDVTLAPRLLGELLDAWGKAMRGGKIAPEAGPEFLEVAGDVISRWAKAEADQPTGERR